VGLQPSRQQQSTCTQWPARRKDGKKRAAAEERKELRAENKSRKRQAKAEEKQPMSGQAWFLAGRRCDPGNVSIETSGGGVFTRALLRHLADPVPFQLMALDVKRAVLGTNYQRRVPF
jgi:hypothetical protein